MASCVFTIYASARYPPLDLNPCDSSSPKWKKTKNFCQPNYRLSSQNPRIRGPSQSTHSFVPMKVLPTYQIPRNATVWLWTPQCIRRSTNPKRQQPNDICRNKVVVGDKQPGSDFATVHYCLQDSNGYRGRDGGRGGSIMIMHMSELDC